MTSYLYCCVNYHHNMEDYSNMPGPTTSQTDEVGGDGEDVSDLVEAADLVEVFGNDDSGDIGISSDEQFHQSGTHSRSVWPVYLARVQVKTEGWKVLKKVIVISGKYGDYVKEIQPSHKLGYPAHRTAAEGSPTLIFTFENNVFCLGAHRSVVKSFTSCNENALPCILEGRRRIVLMGKNSPVLGWLF